jgi:hypothetical protein
MHETGWYNFMGANVGAVQLGSLASVGAVVGVPILLEAKMITPNTPDNRFLWAGIGIAAVLLVASLLVGCSSTRSGPRVPPAHRAEVDRAMAEASRKLGMDFKGGGYNVAFVEGTVPSNLKGRMGKQTAEGVALGTTDSRGNVVIYTTNGAYRFEDLVHEMAHIILRSHGIPFAEHHAIMRSKGFRW